MRSKVIYCNNPNYTDSHQTIDRNVSTTKKMVAVEPQYSTPPPIPQSFKTRQDVKDYCSLYSKAHGYAITTKASHSNKLYLICNHGGVYRNHLNYTELSRVRRMATKKIGYLFYYKSDTSRGWQLGAQVDWYLTHTRTFRDTNHPCCLLMLQ